MESKENLESIGSSANPNSEKRNNIFEISNYDASSGDTSKRARRNISSGDEDEEEEVKSTRSSSSTYSDKTERIDERINLDLNMPALTEEEGDERMFMESAWSNNVEQRDCGDGGGEVEDIKLDLNSTPAPSEGEGYTLEGEVWPEDWEQQVGGCDDDDADYEYNGDDEDYYNDDGGYGDIDHDIDEGNKRINLDLNSTPLSEEGEEKEVRPEEEEEEDQCRYQLDEEEDRPVEVRYQSEEEEEKEKEEKVRLEKEQVWYQEEEENIQEVRPEEERAQYQEEDEEENQYWYQFKGEDQRCSQAEEKGVRSEEFWLPSEEEEVVRLPNIARSNLDFNRTPTKGELEDLKNSTIPPAKKQDDEPEHSSDSNHSSFVCEICVQPKVSSEWFAIKNCGHAYCKYCMIKHVASKLRQNILNISCPTPDCASGSLSPEHCRPILPPHLFDSWASAL